MAGLLSGLPDPKDVTQIAASVQSSLAATAASFKSMQSGAIDSPIGAVANVFTGLNASLSVDVSGISDGFPRALNTMRSAIAPASVDFVQSIESRYREVRSFLTDNALVREIGDGRSLQEAALAAVRDVLSGFDQRRASLISHAVDTSLLQQVRDAFTAVAAFRSNFEAHRNEFLPFICRNLLGVAPDFLQAPLAHAEQAVSVVAALDPAALRAALGDSSGAAGSALRDLLQTIESMQPDDPAAYARVRGLLTSTEAAFAALADAINGLYAGLEIAIQNHAWDTIFSAHRSLLEALSFDAALSAPDVVNGILQALDNIFGRLQAMFGPSEIAERITALSQAIRETFENSPLGEIRTSIREFLGRIREAIESVPTEEIQQTIDAMLARIRTEIDSLDIAHTADVIEARFHDAEQFITNSMNQALADRVTGAVDQLIGNLERLPVDTLVSNFTQLAAQLDQVIRDIESALQDAFNQLSEVLSKLDGLSFKPVGDAVVSEIDQIKGKLASINPNSLSDAEKLAIKGALAVLQAIDFEGFIETNVESAFDRAKNALLEMVDQVAAVLATVRDRIKSFEPRALVRELTSALAETKKGVGEFSARALMRPFYDELQIFQTRLQALSPDALLKPLDAPFQSVRGAVEQLNPDRLMGPLNTLYGQIDQLVDKIDVTPLMDELDRRQKELFRTVRDEVLAAFDALNLPEPLGAFFRSLRPAIEAITGAFFDDPAAEVRRISSDFSNRFRLSALFAPLDSVFDELLEMVESLPGDTVTEVLNGLRATLALGIDAIDPARIIALLRAAQGQLASLAPPVQLGMFVRLPSFRAAFEAKISGASVTVEGEITSTQARFEALDSLVSERLGSLSSRHQRVLSALRSRINSLDLAGAVAAYGRVKQNLDRVVPAFLRSPFPLTRQEIIDGIHSLRPSSVADPVDKTFDRFLAHLQPMQSALEGAVNEFFRVLHDTVRLVSPISVKDAVADIYAALRAKLRVIDPQRLATDLHASVFDPVVSALSAIAPAALAARLDGAFRGVLQALTTNVSQILDRIAGALEQKFQSIRDAVEAVTSRITDAVEKAAQVFQNIIDRIEHVVFVELLERLRRIIETLGVSFHRELDRVRSAFDAMLNAIPLGGSASASAAVSL